MPGACWCSSSGSSRAPRCTTYTKPYWRTTLRWSLAPARAGGATGRASGLQHGWAKVPEITLIFWIIKILTTGMGEATSDFLVHRFPPPVAVIFGALVLTAAMWRQLTVTRYRAFEYWFAVVMVAVFGTMAADVLHIGGLQGVAPIRGNGLDPQHHHPPA